VQERGLNFLGDKDSRYRDLVQLTDPFPNNPGDKRGALVEGRTGRAGGSTSRSVSGVSCPPARTARIR
jgi:hypothetical protein